MAKRDFSNQTQSKSDFPGFEDGSFLVRGLFSFVGKFGKTGLTRCIFLRNLLRDNGGRILSGTFPVIMISFAGGRDIKNIRP